ncbi:hypothetical protein HK405_011063, partial [Cladochytrium tenue]
MAYGLIFAYQLASRDDRVKVVVLTGAGKSFCAGADLSTGLFGVDPDARLEDHRDGGGQIVLEMLRCPKLIVAAINGNAVGIGLTMTLPADLRICVEGAKLATPFTKRGVASDAVSSYFLPRLIGYSNASKVLLTGDVFPASASATSPLSALFSSVLPSAGEVLPAGLVLATRLSEENSLLSMAIIKAQLWRPGSGLGGDLEGGVEEVHERESLALAWQVVSGDAKEGVMSFMQKRKPKFHLGLKPLRESGWWPWWKVKDVGAGV